MVVLRGGMNSQRTHWLQIAWHFGSALLGCVAIACATASLASAAPAWLAPVDISATAGGADVVAVDARGDAVVVWQRCCWIIQAASRPAGGSWQAPVNLSEGWNEAPQVTFNPEGEAIAVWRHEDGGNWDIQSASLPAGGSWQAPVNVSQLGTSSPGAPQVAFDAKGEAVAVWYEDSAGTDLIRAASRPARGSWQAPVNVFEGAAGQGEEERPRLALDPEGEAIVVWEHYVGSSRIILAASRTAGGSWQAPVAARRTATRPAGGCCVP